MKKGIVLIPLPSLIKQSFVLWLSLPISLSRSNPVFLFLSLSLSHSHLSLPLSLCGYPFPSPYHAPALCSSFSPYPSLILISPSLCLCGYPSHLPIAQLRCVPCDRSSGPTCCTCPGAYAGLSIDCTVTESCASTAPSRPPTLWLVSGLVRPVVIR